MSGPWDKALSETADDHPPADALTAVREEASNLWTDLDIAMRSAISGSWSMHCDWLATRIIRLSRLAGATHWSEMPLTLLLDCTYVRLLTDAGVPFEPPDMVEVRRIAAAVR